ncbi:MAG TPA: FkbM family methyltransferase [Kofleriaceae bacterium]
MRPFWYQTFPRATFFGGLLLGANYEREMQLLDALCDQTKTGVDVGAKVGMYTYRIRARSSNVIAFEPNPLFCRMLHKVLKGERTRIEQVACSRTRGTAVMRMPFDRRGVAQFGRSTIDAANPLQHERVARVETIEVETRTLDEYDLSNVGFIKIDVEGHELAVLDGGARTIEGQRPNLLVECNDDHQPGGVAALVDWLRGRDYCVVFLSGRQILDADRYDREEHWTKHTIENFIAIPSARDDIMERLHAAAARASLRRPA